MGAHDFVVKNVLVPHLAELIVEKQDYTELLTARS